MARLSVSFSRLGRPCIGPHLRLPVRYNHSDAPCLFRHNALPLSTSTHGIALVGGPRMRSGKRLKPAPTKKEEAADAAAFLSTVSETECFCLGRRAVPSFCGCSAELIITDDTKRSGESESSLKTQSPPTRAIRERTPLKVRQVRSPPTNGDPTQPAQLSLSGR